MRNVLFFIILLPLFTIAQTDSARITQEKNQIALEAKPVYIKATALIFELRNDVEMAKKGLIKKSEAISHYNSTAGKVMGIKSSFSDVEKALKENGDAYAQLLYLKEEARISYLKAAEAKYESTH